MNTDLKAFVQKALEQGKTRQEIADALKAGQWDNDEIQEGIGAFADYDFSIPVPKKTAFVQPREAFLYIISFIGLYLSAFSAGSLVFSFINAWFPDALTPYGAYELTGGELRVPVASLIVALPLYLWCTRILLSSMRKDPERRRSLVGKWLTYATLVVAASVIVGDLIMVLSSLLGGEITARFLFKALTVFLISGSAFGFYLTLARADETLPAEDSERPRGIFLSRYFHWGVIASVLAIAGYGLLLIGTPGTQRGFAFDQRRVSDLQQISYGVNAYWESAGALPQRVDELLKMPYFAGPTNDPETRAPYEYRATGEKTYELCATFTAPSVSNYPQAKPVVAREEVWSHGAGRACFEREVFGKVRIQ